VRYRGEKHPSQDPDFKQFESMAMGYRAMFILLDTYRVRYGLRSIREMISRYAPHTENHTALYIETVCDLTGMLPDEQIDTRSRRVMVPIVSAMSRVENGCIARRMEVEEGFTLTGF
jgi:hypothetical protein